jgi:Fe-S-cluster-containing dehydrogenase component
MNEAQKCTLYAHFLADGWKEPRCVQACLTGARRYFKVNEAEFAGMIRSENQHYSTRNQTGKSRTN